MKKANVFLHVHPDITEVNQVENVNLVKLEMDVHNVQALDNVLNVTPLLT